MNVTEVASMFPEWVYADCPAISLRHRDSALARQGELTKPAGALGRLETLAEVQASIEAVTTQGVMDFLGRHPLTDGQVLAALGPLAEDELILA